MSASVELGSERVEVKLNRLLVKKLHWVGPPNGLFLRHQSLWDDHPEMRRGDPGQLVSPKCPLNAVSLLCNQRVT